MIPLKIKTNREWKDPEGYRWLAPWTNLVLLRTLVKGLVRGWPRGEYRRINQVTDACRSAVSTLEEGWKRPTTKEYLDFLGFTQGSLEEVRGDIYRSLEDGLIKSVPGSTLKDPGIDLAEFKEFMGPRHLREVRGRVLKEISSKLSSNPPLTSSNGPLRDPLPTDYPPLKSLRREDLTYEMFIELINKTDYLLRNLVISLQESAGTKEQLKKYPHAWAEKKNDDWLEGVYRRQGFTKIGLSSSSNQETG